MWHCTCWSNLTEFRRDAEYARRLKKKTNKYLSAARVATSFKIKAMSLASFSQIVCNVGCTCEVSFPGAVERVLSAMSVLSLDVVPSLGFQCRFNQFDYIDKLVLLTAGPLLVVALLMGAWALQVRLAKRKLPSVNDLGLELPKSVAGIFTDSEADKLKQAFAFLDKDGSGTISMEEVAATLKAFDLDASEGHLDMIFKEVLQKGAPGSKGTPRGRSEISFDSFAKAIAASKIEGRSTSLGSIVDRVGQGAGNSTIYAVLLFTFLILVSTSQTIFEFFRCQTFEEAEPVESYLIRDFPLDCHGNRYKAHVGYAVLSVLFSRWAFLPRTLSFSGRSASSCRTRSPSSTRRKMATPEQGIFFSSPRDTSPSSSTLRCRF